MPRETRSGRPVSTSVGDAGPSVRAAPKGVFRKEGEYWTVGYGGNSFPLKDTKGLGYIAHLLRHPRIEFHVLDLAGGIAGQRDDDDTAQSARGLPRGEEELEKAGIHIGKLGDAGEIRARLDSVDAIGGRCQLRNARGKVSPRRSSRYWIESRKAMPRSEISCRDASGPGISVPTNQILSSRLRGSSVR